MKTLGELRVGDTFYLLHYDGGYCTLIEKHIVSIITEIRIGCIIKWLDKDADIHGFTLESKEYNQTDCTAAYCTIACSDELRVRYLLDNDYKKFINQYNKNLQILDEDED